MNISSEYQKNSFDNLQIKNETSFYKKIDLYKEEIGDNKEVHFYERARTIYKCLKKRLNLITANGKIFWTDSFTYTCQQKKNLIEDISSSLKVLKSDEIIAIRLKEGPQGETYVALMKSSGEIINILKKKFFYAEGSFKKIYKTQLCDLNAPKLEKYEKESLVAFKYLKSCEKQKEVISEFRKEGRLLKILEQQKIKGFEAPFQALGVYIKGFKKGKGSYFPNTHFPPTFFAQSALYHNCNKREEHSLYNNWGKQKVLAAAIGLCESLRQCHDLGISLGDIKTSNILRKKEALYFTDVGGAWIADEFKKIGYHRDIHTKGYSLKKDFTPLKLVNNIEEAKLLRQKIDVFSLGISIYEMISPIKLYDNNKPNDFENATAEFLGKKIRKNMVKKMGRNSSCLSALTKLLKEMCDPDYRMRPSLSYVIESLQKILTICQHQKSTASKKKIEDKSNQMRFENIKKNKRCTIF